MSTDAPAEATPKRPLGFIRRPAIGSVLMALVAYLPLLVTAPGEIGADTKTYLYLDPARLLSRAASMWDTNIGLGTVTHQNIGYLWPMGPWYWFWDTLGVPDWVAQRLWLGTIIFAAGMGVRFMMRELRWQGPGLTVAAFAYALSPYLLHYGARISVILLPFAGLPWLIGLASRCMRRGGWRWPAVFALVTLTVGGVNATSLILVMAGPILWMAHAVWVSREVAFRTALAAGLRITLLTGITSLWWVAGLAVQGAFGIPILRYTETYYTVANAALSTELLRGLGYWFFYGRDALGAWIAPAERMVENPWALALSFTVPGLAVVSGFVTRFANRGYFAALVAVGLVLGVGAHPWERSTPAGAVFKAWTTTDSGLAFRSTPRALPLIALGLAVLLAAGLAAVARRWPGWRLPLSGALLLLVCLNQWALFAGQMVDRNLKRDEHLPQYWLDAAAAMDAGGYTPDGQQNRVYEMPGTDFASYRWGNTVDPITPGLIDRPFVARELIPYGTANSADLLNAWDVPLQEGSFDPATLQPIAQLLGIGTIAHRGDLQYERFRSPRPDIVYADLLAAAGLEEAGEFGTATANQASDALRLDDELYFGHEIGLPDAPAVSLFDVGDPRPIARTVSAATPTLLAGDGAGIVAWARTGALDPDRAIFYPASFAEDPEELEALIATDGAQLVVTDTNRRQGRRWGSVRENDGYTERSDEEPLDPDPGDNRLDKFPGAGNESYTVSEQLGGATVSASGYGNPVSYTPSDRAAAALDGDPSTAWKVAAFDEPRGEFIEIDLDEPVTASSVRLLQRQPVPQRRITEVELAFDDGDTVTVPLGEASWAPPGELVEFGERTFSTLRITISDLNVPRLDRYLGMADAGFAEIEIEGVEPVVEVIRPPTDLLDAAGEDSIDHPLTYVFTRRSANPSEVVVSDEEPAMLRWVDGPLGRSYTAFGSARMSTTADEATIDALIGMTPPDEGGVQVTSSTRLAGDLRSRGASALDGDPGTAWQTPVNDVVGATLEVVAPEPFAFDGFDLTVRNDPLHSLPARLAVSVDGAEPTSVDVPRIGVTEGAELATETVRVPFTSTEATSIRITIEEIQEANSSDWFSGFPTVLPVGIAELGLPVQLDVPPADTPLDPTCRTGMLEIDGLDVPVSIDGTVGEALELSLMPWAACTDVAIPAGSTLLRTEPGSTSGFDLDQVVLASAAGGSAGPDTLVEGPAPVDPPPATSAGNPSRLRWEYDVEGATEPYWVVLGQSYSPGFEAEANSAVDLGEPTLINGYANGWRVAPDEVGSDATISVQWTPQRLVWIALVASAIGVLVCIAMVIRPLRRWGGDALRAAPRSMSPALVDPLGSEGAAMSAGAAAAAALATGVVTWLLVGWPVGVAVGLLSAAALALPRAQPLVRIAGIVLYGAAAGYVVAKQWRNGYLVDFNWMNQFEVTHAWTLAAVALLTVDPLVSWLRRNAAAAGATEADSADRAAADSE